MPKTGYNLPWHQHSAWPALSRPCGLRGVKCGTYSALRRLSAAAWLWRARRLGSHDPLEVGLRSGIAMDRHVLRHVKLQPLDIAIERNGVRADEGKCSARRRRPVHVGVDDDLLLRQIHDVHVVTVIELLNGVHFDRPLAIGDRVV